MVSGNQPLRFHFLSSASSKSSGRPPNASTSRRVRSFSRRWKPLEQCYRMQMRLDSSQPVPKSKGSGEISERDTHTEVDLRFQTSTSFRPSLTSPCSFSLVRFLVTGKWDSEWMLARIQVYVSCHSMFFFFFFFFIGQVLVSDELVKCSLVSCYLLLILFLFLEANWTVFIHIAVRNIYFLLYLF